MTSNKWTLRKALRTLLMSLLTIALIFGISRLVFAFEIVMVVFALIGIIVIVLCFAILLFSLLIYDDKQEVKPVDESWKLP